MRSLVLVIFLFLVLCQANAGYYSVSYSSPGNEIAIVGPLGTLWYRSYTLTPYGYGGAATGDEPPPSFFIGGPGSVTCTGTIAATFTWVNPPGDTEPPPHSVIVEQSCYTAWDGDAGAADNHLGDPEVSKVSNGAAAQIVSNPGYSFMVSLGPTANGVNYNPPVSMVPQAYAAVYYNATATPVRLVIAGALRDAAWDHSCMVGHKLHVTLDTGGYTQDNWAWIFPATYFHHIVWGAKKNNSAFPGEYMYESREIVDHTSADRFLDHFDLVYEDDASAQVMGSCDIIYEGASIGRVQGKSGFEAFKPYVYYARNMATCQWNGLNPGAKEGATSYQTPAWATNSIYGSAYFEGREGHPPRFSPFGDGAWAFIQTLNSNSTYSFVGGGSGSSIFSDYRLDNTYPYGGWLAPSSGTADPATCPVSYWTPADSVVGPPTGTRAWTVDAPTYGIDNLLSYSDNRNFRMMQVYYPMSLGNGVEHIGVYEIAWSISSAGSRSAGPPLPNWNTTNTGGTTSIPSSSLANCNRHLQWNAVELNSGATTSPAGPGGPGGSMSVPGEP